MDDRGKWKNFLDFDQSSGPTLVLPSAPSSPQHTPSAKTSSQINRVPDWPVEDSGREVKADPDSPQVKARMAAPRREWLSNVLSYLNSKFFWAGLAGLLLMWCVLSVIGKAAHSPLYTLFDLDSWDEIQRNMNSLHSTVQSERFSNSEQIQARIKQAQMSMHRCRFLVEDVSTDLGTVVMAGVQEWVFGDQCTSALPVVVRRSHGKIQRALDCTSNFSSVLTTAMHEIQETQLSDHETFTTITARHSSPVTRASVEQIAIDNERLDTVQQSLANLTSIQSHLAAVIKSHQLEHECLVRLEEDIGSLDDLVHHPQEDTTTPQGSLKENQTSTWDCRDFDIPALRDSFFSLAVTVIRDNEQIGHFQSRYYSTSLDSNV